MTLRRTTLVLLGGLCAATMACSSGSGSPTTKAKAGSKGGTDSTSTSDPNCDPNDPKIPCIKDVAEPCDDFHTDYPGDDLCMKPPKNGIQLHVGPDDYTDADAVQPWILPPGGLPGQGPDTNFCYYMKTPNDEQIYSSGYIAHMRPGSHHYIMFGISGDVPDSTVPGSCADRNAQVFGGANFLSGATREVQDATMFGGAPEDEGLGMPLAAHQQLNMNLHFVNVGDNPVLMEIWVNLLDKPADEVTDIVKAIEWLGGITMKIAPHQNQTLQSPTPSNCTSPKDIDSVRLLGVTAHMHANTVRVSMYHQAPGATDKELVFDDFNWSEPTVWRFNSKLVNPLPDRSASKSGAAISGMFEVTPKDTFGWECEVENKTDSTLTFSDKAYTGEMCNIFGMYSSPVASKAWSCYF